MRNCSVAILALTGPILPLGPKGAKPAPSHKSTSICREIYSSKFSFPPDIHHPSFLRNAETISHLPSELNSIMTVMKPRSRMISVRLSEEEYSALRHLCSLTGARSVSDITRDAMRICSDWLEPRLPFEQSRRFRVGMKNLEKKVEQLEAKITTIRADGEL